MSKPGTSMSFFPAGEEVIMGSVLLTKQQSRYMEGQSRTVPVPAGLIHSRGQSTAEQYELPAEATDESEEALKIGAEGS